LENLKHLIGKAAFPPEIRIYLLQKFKGA